MLESLHSFFLSGLIFNYMMVIFCGDPVYAVLFLILAFVDTAFLALIFDIEFISYLFIIIYVGAVAVLFLFIVMMLNTKIYNFTIFNLITTDIIIYTSLLFSGLYFFNSQFLICDSFNPITELTLAGTDLLPDLLPFSQYLYNYNLSLVLISGFILLIAIIGSIIIIFDFKQQTFLKNSNQQLKIISKSINLIIKK